MAWGAVGRSAHRLVVSELGVLPVPEGVEAHMGHTGLGGEQRADCGLGRADGVDQDGVEAHRPPRGSQVSRVAPSD